MTSLIAALTSLCSVVAMALTGVAAAGLIGGFIWLIAQAARERLEARKAHALDVAGALGLQVEKYDELVGHIDGIGIRMYSRDHGGSNRTVWWSYTRCSLLEPLPDGMVVATQGVLGHLADLFGQTDLQLGTDLDPKLRIAGRDEEETRALLTEEHVDGWLQYALGGDGRVELRGAELTLKKPGRHLDHAADRAEEAIELVKALAEATRRPWREVADAYGLEIDRALRHIRGTADGVPIDIAFADGQTSINAGFSPALPPGTAIAHRAHLDGGEEVGDPILDAMILVRSDDIDALGERLRRDAVRGPLLEVVHGFPGSVVGDSEIRLVSRGRLVAGLAKATSAVVELAQALSDTDQT